MIVHAAGKYPIIDVACGSGRNGAFLAQFGGKVICVDKDLTRLQARVPKVCLIKRMDLIADEWPFAVRTVGGIILIDFLHLPLISLVARSLIPGGYFLLETVSGRGENYWELPKRCELRGLVEKTFKLELYKESPTGPPNLDKVSVKFLALRKS